MYYNQCNYKTYFDIKQTDISDKSSKLNLAGIDVQMVLGYSRIQHLYHGKYQAPNAIHDGMGLREKSRIFIHDLPRNRTVSMLSNSFNETWDARSHNRGTPPNPTLLIGLQLTPVSSICFCPQEPQLIRGKRKTNHFTRKEGRNFISRMQQNPCVGHEEVVINMD